MRYSYHSLFFKDLESLDKPDKIRVLKAIEEKIKPQPHYFGKLLRPPLSPFRSARAGDFRIIFDLPKKDHLRFVAVIKRETIYQNLQKRIQKGQY